MLKKLLILLTIFVSTTILIACVDTTTTVGMVKTTTTVSGSTSTSVTNTPKTTTSAISPSTTTTSISTAPPGTTTSISTAPPGTTIPISTTLPVTTTDGTTSINTGPATLNYQGAALANGTVGIQYSANINTATGASGITYSLKSGSLLPDGLSLAGGIITGIPTVAGTKQFVIVADASNAVAPVEATFTIVIEEEEPTGPKTYIFEAEYVDFTDVWGSGWSNTQTEWGMVAGDGVTTPVSNGMYVAYFVPPAGSLKFPFTSDAAGTGKLTFSMVSEYVKNWFGEFDAIHLNPEIMKLKINGTEISYEVFVLGVNGPTEAFKEYVFLEEFAIRQGENMIEIIMESSNDYFPGRVGGGPNVDYMKIESELNLVMKKTCSTVDEVILRRGY
ncbi:MAG: hypothetical protein ACOX16_00605 [Candidatus Izemoplasmatales bacterium]|jgi:hypothetical protein